MALDEGRFILGDSVRPSNRASAPTRRRSCPVKLSRVTYTDAAVTTAAVEQGLQASIAFPECTPYSP